MLLSLMKTVMRESCHFELCSLSEEEAERREKNILAVSQLSGSACLQCIFTLLRVLLVMKTLEDEW